MSNFKPRSRLTEAPSNEEEGPWVYHDVPYPELKTARAQGTIVIAACGFSFIPQPIPEKLIVIAPSPESDLVIKSAAAVELIKCPICADLNHNGFGERPEPGLEDW